MCKKKALEEALGITPQVSSYNRILRRARERGRNKQEEEEVEDE